MKQGKKLAIYEPTKNLHQTCSPYQRRSRIISLIDSADSSLPIMVGSTTVIGFAFTTIGPRSSPLPEGGTPPFLGSFSTFSASHAILRLAGSPLDQRSSSYCHRHCNNNNHNTSIQQREKINTTKISKKRHHKLIIDP